MCSLVGEHKWLVIRVSQEGEHISLEICVSRKGEHISPGICVSLVGEHKCLVIRVSQEGEHISQGIYVLLVREHISRGICVSQKGKNISLGICVFQAGISVSRVAAFYKTKLLSWILTLVNFASERNKTLFSGGTRREAWDTHPLIFRSTKGPQGQADSPRTPYLKVGMTWAPYYLIFFCVFSGSQSYILYPI